MENGAKWQRIVKLHNIDTWGKPGLPHAIKMKQKLQNQHLVPLRYCNTLYVALSLKMVKSDRVEGCES